jgi:hypothetical protein
MSLGKPKFPPSIPQRAAGFGNYADLETGIPDVGDHKRASRDRTGVLLELRAEAELVGSPGRVEVLLPVGVWRDE